MIAMRIMPRPRRFAYFVGFHSLHQPLRLTILSGRHLGGHVIAPKSCDTFSWARG